MQLEVIRSEIYAIIYDIVFFLLEQSEHGKDI